MRMSFQTRAIASVVAAVFIAAPLAMAKETEKSAADGSKAAKAERQETRQVAYLGVVIEPLHPAFWAHLRDVLEHRQGLLVARVAQDSPADKAGLKSHDILMTYGDQKLFSPDQLVGLLRADKAGHKVKLSVLRDGKPQKVMVTLGEHALLAARSVSPRRAWRTPWFTSPGTAAENSPKWESFDSLSLKSLGNNRYKIEIEYKAKDGKMEHRRFEGTREEIHKDIMAQKDLPDNEREHLLRSLDMPGANGPFEFPVYTRDGRVIWGFDDFDSAFSPLLPRDF